MTFRRWTCVLVSYVLYVLASMEAYDNVQQGGANYTTQPSFSPTFLTAMKPSANLSFWDVPLMKGIMKGQILRLEKIANHTNNWHTCYHAKCLGRSCPSGEGNDVNEISFCYPAVIVTGMPKCGTSAMYELLTRYSGAIVMHEKENCPYARRRPHWQFFNSLPSASQVGPHSLVIDGCIDAAKNIVLRNILREPKTIYLVMTRNYADMLWSSYNFWCKREYDGFSCDSSRWVKAHHLRSPAMFHQIVLDDMNNSLSKEQSPLHATMSRPCANAGGYYSEFLTLVLWNAVPANQTLVIASEELERFPLMIWQRVAQKIGIHLEHGTLKLGNFTSLRVNAQESKGGHVALSQYKPGLFAISGNLPLWNSTRALLDACWGDDCLATSKYTSWNYACSMLTSANER